MSAPPTPVKPSDVTSWNRSHSHFSINECLGNCKEQDREEEGSEGAAAPLPISPWPLWLYQSGWGRQRQGKGHRPVLWGPSCPLTAFLSGPEAAQGVGKPQSYVVRSGWPLASLGSGPGVTLGVPANLHQLDSPPCHCSGTSLLLSDQLSSLLTLAFEDFSFILGTTQTLLWSQGAVHIFPLEGRCSGWSHPPIFLLATSDPSSSPAPVPPPPGSLP